MYISLSIYAIIDRYKVDDTAMLLSLEPLGTVALKLQINFFNVPKIYFNFAQHAAVFES